MYSATFIFDTRQFDSERHRLDALIAATTKESDGCLGEESDRHRASRSTARA